MTSSLFHVLIGFWISALGNVYLDPLTIFNYIICFFIFDLQELFIYSWYKSLFRYMICKSFSHSVDCDTFFSYHTDCFWSYHYIRGETTKKKFIYKSCEFILTCSNVSYLHSTLHLMQSIYWDVFSKQFLKSSILITFSTCIFGGFCCLFVCSGKTFSFEDFFHPRKQKKLLRERSGE